MSNEFNAKGAGLNPERIQDKGEISVYVLIEVVEREIHTTKYGTKEEAYKGMMTSLEEVLGFSPEDEKASVDNGELRGDSWGYDEVSAWCSTQDDKYDWEIISLL